jgi:DNA-directed RNA polymerase subunit RPC12/RpoP
VIISLYSINWFYNLEVFTARYKLYLCVLCGSENKQRLFPYTALTGFYNLEGFTARYGLYLCVLCGSENKQRLFPCTALTDWLF